MTKPALLDAASRAAELPALAETGWRAAPDADALCKTLVFASFAEAWGFMSAVALAAEKAGHHPDWSNGYATVRIRLTTHDCGGLSAADLALARAIDRAAAPAAPKLRDEEGQPITRLLAG